MASSKLALVLGSLLPVLRYEPQRLDGSELAQTLLAMGECDLDEEEKRLGLGVVVFLEVSRNGLDLLRVG